MNEEPGRPKYRPDIDGLRGVAVLAVVAFHAFPDVFRGGFIGVDVFFVISGFLITTIILGGLKEGRFTFREFYARRIRRIFPALIVVLVAVLVAGWLTLDHVELQRLGRHVVGGATFSSNFLLLGEDGYFDIGSDRKILLHLWSLAIEEQFYIVFPLILWALHKGKFPVLYVTTGLALISFAWNTGLVASDPAAAFYGPQMRAWELMLGAVLASLAAERAALPALLEKGRRILSVPGAILLAMGFAFIMKETPFPGWWALFPVVGAAFLIAGGGSSWVNRRVLAFRPLVWIGLISFPLYLWHWPLLSFARILHGGTPSWPVRASLAAVAVVLAWMTYRLLERPLRFGKAAAVAAQGLVVPLMSLGIMGLAMVKAEGFADRPVAHQLEGYLQSVHVTTGDEVCTKDEKLGWCRFGAADVKPTAFILGDSHAGSLLPAFQKYADARGAGFLYALTKACPTPIGRSTAARQNRAEASECLALNKRILEHVRDSGIRDVFVIFRWSNYDPAWSRTDGMIKGAEERKVIATGEAASQMQAWLDETVAAYRKIGAHLYLVSDNPIQRALPTDVLRKSRNSDQAINANAVTLEEHAAKQRRYDLVLRRYAGPGVTVLDFSDAYCRDGICPLVKDGRFLYADQHHLSVDGALAAYPKLSEALSGLK